jgi:hypothetical protein
LWARGTGRWGRGHGRVHPMGQFVWGCVWRVGEWLRRALRRPKAPHHQPIHPIPPVTHPPVQTCPPRCGRLCTGRHPANTEAGGGRTSGRVREAAACGRLVAQPTGLRSQPGWLDSQSVRQAGPPRPTRPPTPLAASHLRGQPAIQQRPPAHPSTPSSSHPRTFVVSHSLLSGVYPMFCSRRVEGRLWGCQ